MRCYLCRAKAVCHVLQVRRRSCVGEKHYCEQHEPHLGVLRGSAAKPETRALPQATAGPAVVCDIIEIYIRDIDGLQWVQLEEQGGGRILPLICGVFEVMALEQHLKELPSPRPLTHDGWGITIQAMGGALENVLIDDVCDETFFAKLRIRQDRQCQEVDVRPSDAINLAVRFDAPILVAERVLAVYGEAAT